MRTRLVLKTAAVFLPFGACTSCSYTFPVTAVFIDGQLAFTSDRDAPREPPWCLSGVSVANQRGELAWAIEQNPSKALDGCAGFPLFYGQVPADTVETVGKHPLVPSELYVISG